MARGGYDTTGIPKQRGLPRPNAMESPDGQAREARTTHQVPAPEEPNFQGLLPDPMDIEMYSLDDANRNTTLPEDLSIINAAAPRMSDDSDSNAVAEALHDNMEDDDKSSRPSRFTEEKRLVLDQWMADNHNTPYPTSGEIERLAQATSLSTKQIQQYFCNYRRRRLEKSQVSRVASSSSLQDGQEPLQHLGDVEMEPESVDVRPAGDSPRSTDADASRVSIEARPPSRQSNRSSLSPSLEQSNSPRAQDGTTDCQCLAMPSFSESDDNLLGWWLRVLCDCKTHPSQWESPSEMPPPLPPCTGIVGLELAASGPSVASRLSADDAQPAMGSARSANDSIHWAGSSVYSMATFTSRGSRRGRRAYGSIHDWQLPFSDVNTAHRCEHCGNAFKTGYTLKRHVQSVHEPSERWVCGPVVRTDGSLLCPTCLQDPLDCDHGMLACWRKSEEERTFFRKDLLKQHLRLVHDFGQESTPEDGDTVALLGMHQFRERPNDILCRIGPQLVNIKSASHEWACRKTSLSREQFESCWAKLLRKALERESEGVARQDSAGAYVIENYLEQLRDMLITYDSCVQNFGYH